jgi:hypothetical protein
MNAKRIIIASALFALLLTACRAQAREVPATVVVRQTQMVQAAATAAAQPTAAPPGMGSGEAGYPSPSPAATAAASDRNGPGGVSPLSFAPVGSRMVIKDAEMELLVRDTDVALDQVTRMAGDLGGYILSSQTWYENDFKYATLRLGVPSAEFERALNILRTLALQVVRENASGQDVSAEYTDLQSRLTNLEATAARVREFLADAKTVEESLRINAQLSQLEEQIETIIGQMRFYEGRAAFSTLTVSLTPQYPTPTPTLTPTPTSTPTPTPTLTPTPAWNPGSTFHEASGLLVDVTQSIADVLIWLGVVAGPFILIVGVVFGVARRLFRKRIS